MREDILHFVWRWRRFSAQNLRTTDGQSIEILHPGTLNTDAGPDFFNARLRIDDTEWAGNVEMHVRASEWHAHNHQHDAAYHTVVLHVVWEADATVCRPSGEAIPCLSLQGQIDPVLVAECERLMSQPYQPVPCAHFVANVPRLVVRNWLDRLAVERLEMKTAAIETRLADTEQYWESAFYEGVAKAFGLKVNAEPFAALARSLPLTILGHHKSQPLQIEALLFGQAGWLENDNFEEAYPKLLAKEYRFLQHKYQLAPLPKAVWKFARLRPANFPTVRLAQLAALIHQSSHLFSQVLEAPDVRQLEHLFEAGVSDYWQTHYVLDKPTVKRPKRLGRDFIHLIVINTVVPFLFQYGKARNNPTIQEKALMWLETMMAENNALIADWKSVGLTPENAHQSQALLHLRTHYCNTRRCLQCAIGHHLLR